jgi:hypothetical protein
VSAAVVDETHGDRGDRAGLCVNPVALPGADLIRISFDRVDLPGHNTRNEPGVALTSIGTARHLPDAIKWTDDAVGLKGAASLEKLNGAFRVIPENAVYGDRAAADVYEALLHLGDDVGTEITLSDGSTWVCH